MVSFLVDVKFEFLSRLIERAKVLVDGLEMVAVGVAGDFGDKIGEGVESFS